MGEMILHVGLFQFRACLDKTIDDAGGVGEDALALSVVFDDFLDQRQAPCLLVQGDRQLHPPVHAGRIMIAVVFADAAQFVAHRNAQRLQQFGLADAGQFQQMRGFHRAGGQDDFAVATGFARDAALGVGDADRALAFQQNRGGHRLGDQGQIAARPGRFQKRARGGPAFAVLLGDLVVAEAFLLAVVVVRIARIALGRGGVDEGVQQFGAFPHFGNVQHAALVAGGIALALEIFRLLEVGEHGIVGPAAVSELRPGVVVERIAANIQHAVDRA